MARARAALRDRRAGEVRAPGVVRLARGGDRVARLLDAPAVRLLAFTALCLVVAYGVLSAYAATRFTAVARGATVVLPPELAARAEPVTLRTEDGLALRGWYFASANAERASLLVHGKDGTRLAGAQLGLARALLGAGYAVLAIDLRGHGESEGDRFSLGQHERKDLAAAIDHLVGRGFVERRIALIGHSMGAGTVIQALLVRPGVGAIVADSSYENAGTIVGEQAPSVTGLPGIFTPGIVLAARLIYGIDAAAVDPAAVVKAHPERPFLFIHCDGDGLIAPRHAQHLREASANAASELWIAPGCGHASAFDAYPEEYARRLLAFLDARLLRSEAK